MCFLWLYEGCSSKRIICKIAAKKSLSVAQCLFSVDIVIGGGTIALKLTIFSILMSTFENVKLLSSFELLFEFFDYIFIRLIRMIFE